MKAVLFAVVVALAGCASGPDSRQAAEQAMAARDYVTAERQLQEVLREGRETGLAWNNLGVVYLRTGRLPQAHGALTMGARYGEQLAQQNLVSQGWPVPAVDLVATSSEANAAAALLYFTNVVVDSRSYRPAAPARAAQQMECRTQASVTGSSATTTCSPR